MMALDNALATPGGMRVLGSDVDLGKVDLDAYIVAGSNDHIVDWRNAYRSTQLLGGESRFVLSTSGHIQALINPPEARQPLELPDRRGNPPDTADWEAAALTHRGSWWPDYIAWLEPRSGDARARAEEARQPRPQGDGQGARHLRHGGMTHAEPEPVPPGRWWGDHVGETRWLLEAARLAVDPVWLGAAAFRAATAAAWCSSPASGSATTPSRRSRPGCGGSATAPRSAGSSPTRLLRAWARTGRAAGRRAPWPIAAARGDHRPQSRRPLRAGGGGAAARTRLPRRVTRSRPAGDVPLQRADPGRRRRDAAGAATDGSRPARRSASPTAAGARSPTAFWAPFPDDRVRLTSIYSKGDGVVRWQAQLVPYAECVEVTGSHVGLSSTARATGRSRRRSELAPGLPKRPVASLV